MNPTHTSRKVRVKKMISIFSVHPKIFINKLNQNFTKKNGENLMILFISITQIF